MKIDKPEVADLTSIQHDHLSTEEGGTLSGYASSATNTGDQNVLYSIVVSGQTTVTAASTAQALTLVAGTNVTLTTDNTAKSVTIVAAAGGGSMVYPGAGIAKSDGSAWLTSLADPLTYLHGGTGLNAIAAGSALAANSANTYVAVTSTSGTKVLTNTSGTITWETGGGGGGGDMYKSTYDTNNDGIVDNSDKWDGYQFSDYLNQAVKTNSSPTFANVTSHANLTGANLHVPGTHTHGGGDITSIVSNSTLWDGHAFAGYLNQAMLTTSTPTLASLTITGGSKLQSDGHIVLNNTKGVYGKDTSETARELIGMTGYTIDIGNTAPGGISLGYGAADANPIYIWVGGASKRITIDGSGFLKGV